MLALSRQAVTNVRTKPSAENLSAKGAYVLREPEVMRDVTLIATGAELGIAMEAADALAKEGVRTAVVSMPSMELFRAQPEGYRAQVLGSAPRVAIEASVVQCWHEWIGPNGGFVGLSDFGASAPAPKLFEHFGLTPAKTVVTARALLKK